MRQVAAAGVEDVTLVVGDGARGLPEEAPFDAINVAAAGDITSAGTVTLTAATAVATAGDVNATGAVFYDAGTDITSSGNIVTASTATFTADNDIASTGTVTATLEVEAPSLQEALPVAVHVVEALVGHRARVRRIAATDSYRQVLENDRLGASDASGPADEPQKTVAQSSLMLTTVQPC